MAVIRSQPANDAYRQGWDRIFGKPQPTKPVELVYQSRVSPTTGHWEMVGKPKPKPTK